jgi:hypothetical protein
MSSAKVTWATDLEAALARAAQERKFVLADFSKSHCRGCEALDSETFPDPAVQRFLAEHLVPVQLLLERTSDQPHYRHQRVIWTPTLVFLDRRGVSHYQAPGYLPPREFLTLLRIGLARSLLAWARYGEAARHLEAAAEKAGPLTAEALYWLGMAYYLPARRPQELMRAWGRLREEYPGSVWTLRVPPGQEAEESALVEGERTRDEKA